MAEVDFIHPRVCSQIPGNTRSVNVLYSSKKQQTGQWVGILNAEAFVNGRKVETISSHKIEESGGHRTVTINVTCVGARNNISVPENEIGTVDVSRKERKDEKLLFHSRCGKNAAVVDGGKIFKRTSDSFEYTSGFTNRPLKDNEVFEVRLEKRNNSGYPIAIGVNSKSPDDDDFEIADNMTFTKGTYAYWCNFVNYDGKETNISCEKSTSELKVGQTLGVMRNESGDLHFYFDGIAQGVAVKNVPSNVYGVVELLGRGKQVSIVDGH